MHIRRATVEDCAQLSALALRAKAHWGYAREQLQAWRPELEIAAETIPAHPAFVGEIDRCVIGFYQLVPAGTTWVLDSLWVAPEWMRLGHGRALVAHALAIAAQGGATAVLIDADPNAEPFYLACGATRVGEVAAPIAGHAGRIRPQLVLAARAIDA